MRRICCRSSRPRCSLSTGFSSAGTGERGKRGRLIRPVRPQHLTIPRNLLFHPYPTLNASDLVLAVDAELRIEPLQYSQVCLLLLGQLTDIMLFELAYALLLLVQSFFHLLKLHPEELSCSNRLTLTDLRVLFDVEGC